MCSTRVYDWVAHDHPRFERGHNLSLTVPLFAQTGLHHNHNAAICSRPRKLTRATAKHLSSQSGVLHCLLPAIPDSNCSMAESYATRDLKLQDDSAHGGAVTTSGQMKFEEQPFVLTPARDRRAHCAAHAVRAANCSIPSPAIVNETVAYIMNRTPLIVATQTGYH